MRYVCINNNLNKFVLIKCENKEIPKNTQKNTTYDYK